MLDLKMTTFVRRNFEAPVNVVPVTSNCPDSNKFCIILSEMLRFRRICSGINFIKLNDQFLFNEMLRAGYFQSKLHTEFNKALKYIQLNYNSETFVKEIDKNDIDDLYYCGKITYDASSGNYRVIRNLLGGKKCSSLKI